MSSQDEPLPTKPDPDLVQYREDLGGPPALPWALLLIAALAAARILGGT